MATNRDPRTLLAIGVVFVVLSAAMVIWSWVRGDSPGPAELGILTGGLIVLAVGLFLQRRRRPPDGA